MKSLSTTPFVGVTLALLLGVACSSPSPSGPQSTGPVAPDPIFDPAPDEAPDIAYGSQCTPSRSSFQGTCPEGLLCFPVPNGYCSGFCGDGLSCGEGGVCIESHRGGQGCARACASDADCRAAEGHVCDPTWKACILPGAMALAPKAPECSGRQPSKHSFGVATQLSTAPGGGIGDLEVHAAVDADGDLTAAYISQRKVGMPNPLGLVTVKTDGTIESERNMTTTRQRHYDPWLASDRNGRLSMVWLGYDGASAPEKRMQIGFSSSANGIDWSAATTAHAEADCPGEAPGCMDKPMIASGPDVANIKRDVLYVAYTNAKEQRLVKSVDGGKTFSASTRVSDHAYGDIHVDARGHLHVINSTVSPRGPTAFGDPAGRIEYVHSQDGGETFSSPIVVNATGESIAGMFVNPQIRSDAARGVLYAVYPAGGPDTRWDIMLAVSRDGGTSWKRTQVNDDSPCANHRLPAAALDPKTGRLHVMWVDNRDGAGLTAYASCDSNAVCTANERISDASFAAYSFSRHTTMWLGDYNSLVLDDARRTLHAVWAQPVDEDGVPRSRIFHAKMTLP